MPFTAMRKEKKSLPNTIFHYFVIIILILILPITSFSIYHLYTDLNKNSKNFRENFIDSQKLLIKSQVDNIVSNIHYKQSQIETQAKQQLQERIAEAGAIAQNIYDKNQTIESTEEIQKEIIEALRPIRFEGGKGHFTIADLSGTIRLNSIKSEMEGSNILKTDNEQQNKIFQDAIETIKKQKEGYFFFPWKESDSNEQYIRMSYCKIFLPYNWIIESGVFIHDLEDSLQNETLKWIKTIRYNNDNYIFAAKWDGTSLSGPSEGSNILKTDKSTGKAIMQKIIDLTQKGGGYITYDYVTMENNKTTLTQKISYVQGIPAWGWYIGTGIYVYNMEKDILDIRKNMLNDLRQNMIQIFCITLLGIGIAYWFTKWMENRIDHEMKKFTTFFRLSSQQSLVMDTGTLVYEEFRDLAQSLNDMLIVRKTIENRLRDSEEQVRLLLDSTAEAIFGVDLYGHCILANPSCLRLLGFDSLEEIIGYDTHQLFHYAYPDGKPCPVEECSIQKTITLQQGIHSEIEYFWHKNQTCFPVELWSYPISRENRIVGVVVTFMDITEKVESEKKKKDLENQLIQIHKMEAVGQLAGGIAHDFNNILTGVIGNLALAEPHVSPPYNRFIRNAVNASQRAAGLVQKLLEFSRKTSISMEIIDIKSFIQDFFSMVRETIDRRIEILTKVESEIPCIQGDGSQLLTVLLNLCINASDAIKDILNHKIFPERANDIFKIEIIVRNEYLAMDRHHGSLHIPPGNYIVIEISDNGPGIPLEIQHRVFEPFFTTKEVGKGTGLGLSRSYGIINQHGGILDLSSEPGGGTVFLIYLPAIRQKPKSVQLQDERIKVAGTETILVIDDEDFIRNLCKQTFQPEGYTVMEAADGIEGIEKFKINKDQIDLIILDLSMPNLSGTEAVKKLKEIDHDVKILICSGYAHQQQFDELKEFNIGGYCPKPFTPQDILTKIRNILDTGKKIKSLI